jgi:hypothetical protein
MKVFVVFVYYNPMVFSTKERAEHFISNTQHPHWYNISECELDEHFPVKESSAVP